MPARLVSILEGRVGYMSGGLRQIGAYLEKNRDRMGRSGMRWSVAGAQAMLDLRTTYVNGQWEAFQEYRIEQETLRLYPHQEALEKVQWPIAA